MTPATAVPALVEAHLTAALGPPDARAAVTFVGADRVEVLRFRDGDVVRYATLGMSAQPMAAPGGPGGTGVAGIAGGSAGPGVPGPLDVTATDPVRGPRAELVLTVRAGAADTGTIDKVVRPLAVLAASPQVEGVVVAPGNALELGGPLWPGARFSAVLVGESGGLVPDLVLAPPMEPVRVFPVLPMTANEAAWKRVRGAAALQEAWLAQQVDLRDPARASARL